MRKAAPLLAVALLVLLPQALGGLLTACQARDGLVRLELVHGDCCEARVVERSEGCCDSPAAACAGEAAAEDLDVGLNPCCESVELLFRYVIERQLDGSDGTDGASLAALPPAMPGEVLCLPAPWVRGGRRTGPVPRPPPGLASLRTIVLLC